MSGYEGYGPPGDGMFIPEPVPAPQGTVYKRCSCRKARCLKLYCVCFSAGVYCSGCTCKDCVNVPEQAACVMQERQKILQRSPRAFSSKVDVQQSGVAHHKKGCRCRRSKCLKKYCECFDQGVRCCVMCRCENCENQPDGPGMPPMEPLPPPMPRGRALDYGQAETTSRSGSLPRSQGGSPVRAGVQRVLVPSSLPISQAALLGARGPPPGPAFGPGFTHRPGRPGMMELDPLGPGPLGPPGLHQGAGMRTTMGPSGLGLLRMLPNGGEPPPPPLPGLPGMHSGGLPDGLAGMLLQQQHSQGHVGGMDGPGSEEGAAGGHAPQEGSGAAELSAAAAAVKGERGAVAVPPGGLPFPVSRGMPVVPLHGNLAGSSLVNMMSAAGSQDGAASAGPVAAGEAQMQQQALGQEESGSMPVMLLPSVLSSQLEGTGGQALTRGEVVQLQLAGAGGLGRPPVLNSAAGMEGAALQQLLPGPAGHDSSSRGAAEGGEASGMGQLLQSLTSDGMQLPEGSVLQGVGDTWQLVLPDGTQVPVLAALPSAAGMTAAAGVVGSGAEVLQSGVAAGSQQASGPASGKQVALDGEADTVMEIDQLPASDSMAAPGQQALAAAGDEAAAAAAAAAAAVVEAEAAAAAAAAEVQAASVYAQEVLGNKDPASADDGPGYHMPSAADPSTVPAMAADGGHLMVPGGPQDSWQQQVQGPSSSHGAGAAGEGATVHRESAAAGSGALSAPGANGAVPEAGMSAIPGSSGMAGMVEASAPEAAMGEGAVMPGLMGLPDLEVLLALEDPQPLMLALQQLGLCIELQQAFLNAWKLIKDIIALTRQGPLNSERSMQQQLGLILQVMPDYFMQQQQQLAAQDPAAAAAISAAAAAAAPDAHLAVAGALAGQPDGSMALQQGAGVAGTSGDAAAAGSGAGAVSAGAAAPPAHPHHTRRLQHSATSTPVAPPPAPRVTPASAGSRGRSTGTAPGSGSQRHQQQPVSTTPAAPVAHHYSTRKAAQRSLSKLQPLQVPSHSPAEGGGALTPSAAGLQVPLVGASPWEMLLETVAGVTADEEQQEAVASRSGGAPAPLLRRREPQAYQAPPTGYSQLLAGKLGPEAHHQEQLPGPGEPRVGGGWQQAGPQPMEEDLASRFLESSEGEEAVNGEGGGGGMRRGALKLVCGSFRIQGSNSCDGFEGEAAAAGAAAPPAHGAPAAASTAAGQGGPVEANGMRLKHIQSSSLKKGGGGSMVFRLGAFPGAAAASAAAAGAERPSGLPSGHPWESSLPGASALGGTPGAGLPACSFSGRHEGASRASSPCVSEDEGPAGVEGDGLAASEGFWSEDDDPVQPAVPLPPPQQQRLLEEQHVSSGGAAAGPEGLQESPATSSQRMDVPASSREPDTDKAAARCGTAAPGGGSGASYMVTLSTDGEVPAKRRRRDLGPDDTLLLAPEPAASSEGNPRHGPSSSDSPDARLLLAPGAGPEADLLLWGPGAAAKLQQQRLARMTAANGGWRTPAAGGAGEASHSSGWSSDPGLSSGRRKRPLRGAHALLSSPGGDLLLTGATSPSDFLLTTPGDPPPPPAAAAAAAAGGAEEDGGGASSEGRARRGEGVRGGAMAWTPGASGGSKTPQCNGNGTHGQVAAAPGLPPGLLCREDMLVGEKTAMQALCDLAQGNAR